MRQQLLSRAIVISSLCFMTGSVSAVEDAWPHDPTPEQPFGSINPALTDPEAQIFKPLIGIHDCTHVRTVAPGAEPQSAKAVWTWYYDMNGYGVRDTYRYDKAAPASQRIYNVPTKQWHVWYFLGQGGYYAGEWIGGVSGENIVFEQTAEAAGRTILSSLQFFDITENSFEWKSSNIDTTTGETFVSWEISCKRRQ